MEDFPGEYCREAGLTTQLLLDAATSEFDGGRRRSKRLRGDKNTPVSNGLVLELAAFMTSKKLPWSALHTWLSTVEETLLSCTANALTAKVRRLQAARTKLLKASDHKSLSTLCSEEFAYPQSQTRPEHYSGTTSVHACSGGTTSSEDGMGDVDRNTSGSEICSEAQGEGHAVDAMQTEDSVTLQLQDRLHASQSKIRNLGKKLRRRDDQLIKYDDQLARLGERVEGEEESKEDLEEQLGSALETVETLRRKLNNVYCRVSYEKSKSSSTSSAVSDVTEELLACGQREKELKRTVSALQAELDVERSMQQCQHITAKVDGEYTPEVRQCCYDLLAKNVGVWNLGSVIRSVLRLANVGISEVPSAATASKMLVELRQISQLHVASTASDAQFTTSHSDGTSKQGTSFQSFQLATNEKAYSLGMVEMKNGTAKHVFEMFKQVLGDIDSVASASGQTDVAKHIVKNMKNTMSDRCVVQKSYNVLLEEYRKDILPDVVDGWEELSEDEQATMGRVNNIYCGMHYIVGLADSCTAALKLWEVAHFGKDVRVGAELLHGTWQGNGGVARLIYSASKAFERHGDEAAGCVADFHAFLSETNTKLPLEEYRGNRSYVVFRNGAGVYYLHEKMLHFLTEVTVRDNQLLRAVKADLGVAEFVAGARALGLLSKLVIGPLWCLLEDPKVSILEVSKYYTELNSNLLKWSTDASNLLDGSARPFSDAKVSVVCDVYTALVEPSEVSDALTLEILAYLCSTLAAFTTRLLADHLPGGKYHHAPTLATETASVQKTNAISERDFAQLDRLKREKPNAATVALEGMIMFANNETTDWLRSLPPSEHARLVEVARSTAPAARQQFKDRRLAIQQHRLAELKRKQKEKEAKRQADIARQEQLTKAIEPYTLWTGTTNIEEELAKLTSVTRQRDALRAQLQFRKFVIGQNSAKELFYLSSGGRVLPIPTLVSNLKKLIGESTTPGGSATEASSSTANQ
ncbi:uncharacterized protein LOC135818005 [Sycon ciliatum]|uniref:uncharacterized protein LOC135818005 n=1 Tax=Sycon ciliatum TaxID=27933 RepID=UPI0031F6B507